MKKELLFIFVLLIFYNSKAQTPIFNPSMTIVEYNVLNSPSGEEVDKIIDGDINTKLLDFDETDGTGFTVDLGGTSRIATSIEITTANDAEGRDPQDFEVLGSNDGTNFTSIASGVIPCISTRFFKRTLTFTNSTSYSYYRINFSDNECNNVEGIIQVAEVQLIEPNLNISENYLSDNNLKIHPNPSRGNFKINYSGNEKLLSARVYNLTGKFIKNIDMSNFSEQQNIYLKNVTSGVYFIHITSSNSTVIKKIVIL
ncbi:T9SS type A sorting domain-containing protein [Pseudofulvibacter geojedonensis]|uniref:T9SS type A sorting domain-containing protein n=1 Tax=Pseudofulvibacter geojedonensis TaxID=1123758 RepID=A0ABW3I484_9FLAO